MTPDELLEHAHGYAHELIRTADPEGEHLAGYLAEHADGTLQVADYEAICELMATCDAVLSIPGRWDLPAEPGPEVLALADVHDRIWIREDGHWGSAQRRIFELSWRDLIAYYHPVRDATSELSAPPSGATAVTP